MKKKYSNEKTDIFTAYNLNNEEFSIIEYTYFEYINKDDKPVKKSLFKNYKTSQGYHVMPEGNNRFLVLTNYGEKNFEVNKVKGIK
ncbi:MAG: hypothetical protein JW969_06330 [Spirochaetales bacterium]|nr:hypothetical protein [Spirochaetales bacterium]